MLELMKRKKFCRSFFMELDTGNMSMTFLITYYPDYDRQEVFHVEVFLQDEDELFSHVLSFTTEIDWSHMSQEDFCNDLVLDLIASDEDFQRFCQNHYLLTTNNSGTWPWESDFWAEEADEEMES